MSSEIPKVRSPKNESFTFVAAKYKKRGYRPRSLVFRLLYSDSRFNRMIVPRFGFYFRVGIRELAKIGVPRGIDKNYAQVRAERDFRMGYEKELAQEWRRYQ